MSKVTGSIILLVGSIQWMIMILISESLKPNYNGALHYVSTLGTGSTTLIYNVSILVFGLTVSLFSAIIYSFLEVKGQKVFPLLLFVTGVFIIGVGLFPEDIRPVHGYVTAFAFIFAVASAIVSFKALKPPFSYISLGLGLITLVLLILFFPYLGLPVESTITFLGLKKGTIERILIYLLLFWVVGISINLLTERST